MNKELFISNEIEQALLSVYEWCPQWWLKNGFGRLFPAITYAAIFIVLSVALAAAFQVLTVLPNGTPLIQDMNYWGVIFTLSSGIYLYFAFPHFVADTLNALEKNEIFTEKLTQADLADAKKVFASPVAKWLPLPLSALAALAAYIWFTQFSLYGTWWYTSEPKLFLIVLLFGTIGWTPIIGFALNFINVIRCLNRLFKKYEEKNAIVVYKLHPDGAGGFSPLGLLSLRVSLLSATLLGLVVGLFFYGAIVRNRIQQDYLAWSLLVIYVVMVPSFFFYPLLSAHRVMKNYRKKLLLQLSKNYFDEYHATAAKRQDNAVLSDHVKRLDDLQSLYKTTQELPVWPFNTRILTVVILNTLVPLVTAAIGQLISKLFA